MLCAFVRCGRNYSMWRRLSWINSLCFCMIYITFCVQKVYYLFSSYSLHKIALSGYHYNYRLAIMIDNSIKRGLSKKEKVL
jgi:hypothetical protein